MMPRSAPTAAAAGSVIQNGALRLAEQDSDRERARGDQAGMPQRDLSGIAGQQHERERADEARNTWQARSSWNGDAISGNASSASDEHAPSSCVRAELHEARGPGRSWCGNSRWRAGRLDTVELLARAEQPPWAHDQRGNEHQERDHVGEQRIDIVDGEHLGRGHDERAEERAEEAVEARRPAPARTP